jgi:hypothetical protein
MVADAGAYFQHRSAGEIEVERRKVLETTLIVPKIVKGPEGEVGCLQNPVVGLRATRTWIGRHGVHGASPVNWIDFAAHRDICLRENWHGCGGVRNRLAERGRDSNPRYALRAYNGLANRRLQPLGHLSGNAGYAAGGCPWQASGSAHATWLRPGIARTERMPEK